MRTEVQKLLKTIQKHTKSDRFRGFLYQNKNKKSELREPRIILVVRLQRSPQGEAALFFYGIRLLKFPRPNEPLPRYCSEQERNISAITRSDNETGGPGMLTKVDIYRQLSAIIGKEKHIQGNPEYSET